MTDSKMREVEISDVVQEKLHELLMYLADEYKMSPSGVGRGGLSLLYDGSRKIIN